jgi:transposase
LEGEADQIGVRGTIGKQPELLCLINPESRVPATHPLRAIKSFVDEVLRLMSDVFEKMYAQEGRPSIAPERLLKAKVLIALYSVRSERLFCEMLEYNLLFRWFLDMDMMDGAWDPSTFSKNQERLKTHCVGAIFFTQVVERGREELDFR